MPTISELHAEENREGKFYEKKEETIKTKKEIRKV